MSDPGRAVPPRMLDQVILFNYVTAPNTPTYRAILEVFFAAKQHFAVELRPVEILQELRRSPFVVEVADEKALELSLDQLAAWGNLIRAHDGAAVGRIDDFYRKRFVYHLSGVGEAAHRAVREVEEAVGKSGALQAGMLARIRDSLRALAEAERAPNVLGRHFQDLFAAFESLTEQANRFIGELNRRLDEGAEEVERFAMMKQAIFAYIERFVEQLRALEGQIGEGIEILEQAGVQALIELAARSEDIAPGFGDEDPRQAWIDDQRKKWEGVRLWFVGGPGHASPIVAGLARAAVNAVVGLTRALGRLNDVRGGGAGRKAEFLALARGFAACADDVAAHDLWRDAFGAYPSRHFHMEEVDPDLTGAGTSWWDAAPVDVPVRLRTRGQISRAGRPSPVPDRAAEKQWMAERRRRERAQVDAAMARFVGRGELRMSDFGTLKTGEFDLLLLLLDEALISPRRSDGTRRTKTRDGGLDVVLAEPAGGDVVAIDTPRGLLRCRDFIVTVSEAAGAHLTDARRRNA